MATDTLRQTRRKRLEIPPSVSRQVSVRQQLENMFGQVWDMAQLEREFNLLHAPAVLRPHVVVFHRTRQLHGTVVEERGFYHSFETNGADRRLAPPEENDLA